MSVFTALKKARNQARAVGGASYTTVYSEYDSDKPNNKVSIMGNPSLGEVKTMMIGVRNNEVVYVPFSDAIRTDKPLDMKLIKVLDELSI